MKTRIAVLSALLLTALTARAAYEAPTDEAFRSGMKAINQGGFDKEMFDRAMDYLVQDYGQRIGEITNFVEMSGGFLETVDIQNAVCEEDFLRQIEEWEKKVCGKGT